MNMRPIVSATLLAAALLGVGCGHDSSGTKSKAGGGTLGGGAPTMPQPGWNPAGGATPGATGNAAQLLQQLGQAWAAVNTLSARYQLQEKKGGEVESAKVTFYFKKPGRYRYEVAQHTTAIKNGSTSVFDTRSRQITSRPGGALSFIPLKGTLDDARSKSVRGWTLDMTDYQTQLEMFLAPGAAVTAGTGATGPTLELARPTRYAGAELMRCTLDPQRMLPSAIEIVQSGQVVYNKRFSQIQVNPSISADKFTL